jgi:Pyruvate/2-oxoacid:ferredoxin oxidoreductase delta subunit
LRGRPEITRMADLPKVPITIGDMTHNRTGLWRYLMPAIHDRVAPCQIACPLGMPSPDFINDLIRQDAARALDRIMELNPLPGITGRLCYHPCQSKCLRRGLDSNVQIQRLERYLADKAPEPATSAPESLKAQVAVLGAGPLGLSTAYFLGRMGISVTVCDLLDQPGGFLASVDNDKLPKEILGRETTRLIRLANIQLKLGGDYSALDSGGMKQGWRLIIHDRTAHAKDSGPAKSLIMLSSRLSSGHLMLDTTGVCPRDIYKANQIAIAVAAGRELAVQALISLGFRQQSDELKGLINSGQTESAISTRDIRYELFDEQESVCVDSEGQALYGEQALAEAKRCLSCGHCNLCGRCLVFCPDVSLSVNKQGTKPEVDEMHCKGCGICAYECPRRAITMER